MTGPGTVENQFSVATVRNNPAAAGHVTGKATYSSFLSSVLGGFILVYYWSCDEEWFL